MRNGSQERQQMTSLNDSVIHERRGQNRDLIMRTTVKSNNSGGSNKSWINYNNSRP
jgi:hypothetical protein